MTTLIKKLVLNTLWLISIPYSRDPIIAHDGRMLAKILNFSFTFDNFIYLKVKKSHCTYSYPKNIAFHKTVSTSY